MNNTLIPGNIYKAVSKTVNHGFFTYILYRTTANNIATKDNEWVHSILVLYLSHWRDYDNLSYYKVLYNNEVCYLWDKAAKLE